jgi:hypothetical protein
MSVSEEQLHPKEHLNPSEMPEKGGRNAALTVWGVLALLVLAAILMVLLLGRRPLSGTGDAASITSGPSGTASGLPNSVPPPGTAPDATQPNAPPAH